MEDEAICGDQVWSGPDWALKLGRLRFVIVGGGSRLWRGLTHLVRCELYRMRREAVTENDGHGMPHAKGSLLRCRAAHTYKPWYGSRPSTQMEGQRDDGGGGAKGVDRLVAEYGGTYGAASAWGNTFRMCLCGGSYDHAVEEWASLLRWTAM